MWPFDQVGEFVRGLRNYDMVPWKPTPAEPKVLPPPPPEPAPSGPSAATKAQGWSKKLEDCHPRLRDVHPLVEAEWKALHPEFLLQMDYTWRSPEFQFELFKKGREFKNGVWVVVNKDLVVTEKDGSKPSHHNVYPSQALDLYIKRNGVMLWPSAGDVSIGHNALYAELGRLYAAHGLVSGAVWKYNWKDWDHVQVDYPIV